MQIPSFPLLAGYVSIVAKSVKSVDICKVCSVKASKALAKCLHSGAPQKGPPSIVEIHEVGGTEEFWIMFACFVVSFLGNVLAFVKKRQLQQETLQNRLSTRGEIGSLDEGRVSSHSGYGSFAPCAPPKSAKLTEVPSENMEIGIDSSKMIKN